MTNIKPDTQQPLPPNQRVQPCSNCGHTQFIPNGACQVCLVCGTPTGGCG